MILCGFFLLCYAVARFDFSWCDPEYHQETLENLKTAIKGTKKLCAVSFLPYIVASLFFNILLLMEFKLVCFMLKEGQHNFSFPFFFFWLFNVGYIGYKQ